MDNASAQVCAARLVPEETKRAVLHLLRTVVEEEGLFCSLYSDRASLFVTTRHRDARHRQQQARPPTRVARVLQEPGVQLILAHSLQAKGRIERLFGIQQGHLPQAQRVRGLTTDNGATTSLDQALLPWPNRHLMGAVGQPGAAFVPCPRPDVERTFAHQHIRTVAEENTVP